ncbi:KLHL10 (predicted) [Pycnogonum litorale]
MSQMDGENCIGIWRFGLFYKAEKLAKNARRFILANFRSIFTNSEEFENLEVTELAELIGDDRLNVDDERIVWDSIVKWIQCCERDRISTLTVLVNNIRLGICSIRNYWGPEGFRISQYMCVTQSYISNIS